MTITKNRFNHLAFMVLLTLLGGFVLSCQKNSEAIKIGKSEFNRGWEFYKDYSGEITPNLFTAQSGLAWEKVSLPHTANIEPLVIQGQQWQGVAIYRKTFELPKTLSGKHVAIQFDGAMQAAQVFLNNELIFENQGGYLPFYVDITEIALYGEPNVLLVKLDNLDNPSFLPGKPIADLDFNFYSGIYRNVWLVVKSPVYITNAVAANKVATGGVFVTYSNVSAQAATVSIATDVQNSTNEPRTLLVEATLTLNGAVVAQWRSASKTIQASGSDSIVMQNTMVNPQLWHPNNPTLYNLQVNVVDNNEVLDSELLKIGIRTIAFSADKGFQINGETLKLRGTNRHQEYPYIGYAISDNANYRDAFKIKEAGFNFVRCSHYPQTESFLKACDELGILVMDAIPGWQFFGDSVFQQNAFSDIRKMVRRDRNHPSIIMWEASLNESGMTPEFMQQANAIVHQEYPGPDVYTCGWLDDGYDVFIPARQHNKPPYYWNKYDKPKPLFIAEYGDWEYYAQNAGFNQKTYADLSDEERNSRQLRGYGQKRLAQQALNYQEAHNSNLQGPACGDANWLMFDYNRGYAPDIEASGISDIFRLPKFAFYFYQSQARIGESALPEFAKPMVYIANFYNDPSFTEVKVYSNGNEVELFQNGKSLGKQAPDADPNTTHLINPPFTFKLDSFVPGTLEAVAYRDKQEVARYTVITPGEPAAIKLWYDQSGKPLQSGCNDVVFVYAAVVDAKGTIIPEGEQLINFSFTGDAQLMGNNPAKAEAGIATILLKAGVQPGSIVVSATANQLAEAKLEITTSN